MHHQDGPDDIKDQGNKIVKPKDEVPLRCAASMKASGSCGGVMNHKYHIRDPYPA